MTSLTWFLGARRPKMMLHNHLWMVSIQSKYTGRLTIFMTQSIWENILVASVAPQLLDFFIACWPTYLSNTEGINLLVYLVLCNKQHTNTMLKNYSLVHEIFCDSEVPIAIIITGCKIVGSTMNGWWPDNEASFKKPECCSMVIPAFVYFKEYK